MIREIAALKTNDWSLDLEDEFYLEHWEDLLEDSAKAIRDTAEGCYVNLVTHGELGHPEERFIPELKKRLAELGVPVKNIVYVDECGCGGHVTRVYR